MTAEPLRTGVIGAGTMGENHARVYNELPNAELVGVADADYDVGEAVANSYDTDVYDVTSLLERVDAVSVAVPTSAHAAIVAECIDLGVHALVEKPFVSDPNMGSILAKRAKDAGVTLQIGHVERFNPAVRALEEIVPNLDILAVDARRLGPPVSRQDRDNVVLDLMIHDLDIVRSILGGEVRTVDASMTADGDYTIAQCTFGTDTLASFAASRVTQQKVRQLGITARECYVIIDYIDQSIEIHRNSTPSYVREDGDFRHSVESVVERPLVDSGEPLTAELDAFLSVVRNGDTPLVTAADGIQAVRACQEIVEMATESPRKGVIR